MTTLKHKLTSIDGIGDTTADELIAAGVTKVSDLKKAKFNAMLRTEAKYAVMYPCSKELSWDFVNSVIVLLQKHISKNLIGVGGYRRERAIMSEIDIITTSDLSAISEAVQLLHNRLGDESTFKFIAEYASGDRRRSMIISFRGIRCRMDIFKILPIEKPYALLHYTGNSLFNIRVRAHAKKLGFKLNQFGLYDKDNNLIVLKSEREILTHIGITYKQPSARSE
jgi:DNA polymerase/3'-5' exonuclease PolX